MVNNRYKSTEHNITYEALILIHNNIEAELYSLKDSMSYKLSLNDNTARKHFILKEHDLENGEILYVLPNGNARTIFSPSSLDNTLFVTEQCNNRCLMCSQPPTLKNDINHFFRLNTQLLKLISSDTSCLGITGGEPTLLGSRLLELIRLAFKKNPELSLHMLSNGRAFADKVYAYSFAEFTGKDFMIGIPLHSDFELDHDRISGVKGAYNQTLLGIYNLALFDIKIELRIVLNKINYKRLPQIANFIYRNLPFVSHVAFMGLEYTGLTLKNSSQIWINPTDYIDYLEKAVLELADWDIRTSIYNLPLCLLRPSMFPYSRQSISDWKECYMKQCDICKLKGECGGLFSTSQAHNYNIDPFI